MHSEISLWHESKLGKLGDLRDALQKRTYQCNCTLNVLSFIWPPAWWEALSVSGGTSPWPSAVAAEAADLYSDGEGFLYQQGWGEWRCMSALDLGCPWMNWGAPGKPIRCSAVRFTPEIGRTWAWSWWGLGSGFPLWKSRSPTEAVVSLSRKLPPIATSNLSTDSSNRTHSIWLQLSGDLWIRNTTLWRWPFLTNRPRQMV